VILPRYFIPKYLLFLGFVAGILSFSTIHKDIIDEEGVIVLTNKSEYSKSETITIVITNNLSEDIFSAIGSGTPVYAIKYVQRKICNDKWENLFAQCQYPNCIIDCDGPQVIKPGQSQSMEWNPLLFIDGTPKSIQANPGQYRLLILYTDSDRKEWKSIYSNRFVIN